MITKPSNTSADAELQTDLDVLCRVDGRPPPEVTWEFKGGPLPTSVVVKSEPVVHMEKVSMVSKRLTWSTNSTIEERRKTGGVYTCMAKVEDQDVRHNMKLDVHCKLTWLKSFSYSFSECCKHNEARIG